MKITELLKKDTIIIDLKSKSKPEVINELVNKLNSAGRLNNKEEYKKAILKREEQFSTGIGDGIAIPHAKTAAVKIPSLAFGRSKAGIDYDSLDGNNAHIFFMIAAREGTHNDYLDTLSRLSSMLINEEFRKKLMNAKTAEDILTIIDKEESYLVAQEVENEEIREEVKQEKGLILAVTACPTGIAHTYMAADALKHKARDMGVNIKVETCGSTGVKNELRDEDIAKASAIIVAADKQVEMARFEGKKVIQVPVVQGIKKSEELINRALNGDAPAYHHSEIHINCKTTTFEQRDNFKGEKKMTKKILISHSSKDKLICNAFVELLESIGIDEEQILYTSSSRHGIPGGEDIFDYLRQHIAEGTTVYYMLSDNYYESVYCLNEMGAAWVAQNDFSTFMLPNFTKGIKGVINSNKRAYSLESPGDLINLKNKLINSYGLNISEQKWEYVKNKFLDIVRNIV